MEHIVYVMRHGETDWNAAGRLQGHTDVPLNESGRAQAREAASRLLEVGIARIVSSDLSRAQETARILAASLGAPVEHEHVWRERCFGIFEGLTWDEIALRHPAHHAAWQRDRTSPIPGAETVHELFERSRGALHRAAARLAEGERGLVVTHGGVVRALLLQVLGEAAPRPIPNVACYRFLVEPDRIVSVELPAS